MMEQQDQRRAAVRLSQDTSRPSPYVAGRRESWGCFRGPAAGCLCQLRENQELPLFRWIACGLEDAVLILGASVTPHQVFPDEVPMIFQESERCG
jgi:hypothetical protein